jgi:hypothetical protein
MQAWQPGNMPGLLQTWLQLLIQDNLAVQQNITSTLKASAHIACDATTAYAA